MLEELAAAGKDKLLISPHGAFHYFPYHLIGPEGAPLADHWTVTYLPTLALLGPRPIGLLAARMGRRETVASFGLTYDDDPRPGLPKLEESAAEAAAVAAAFGVAAVPEADATRAQVLDALQNARFVHVSAHGRHNVDAPWFQTLFLRGEGKAGRLEAHELLGLDLRGLELVTLSACETALGRFDRNDNLYGLPAALLLAGAATVVGTLWPARAVAAELFFPALYEALAAETPIDDAFALAQRATRKRFPRYRDWGPFYLMGAPPPTWEIAI
jgi:CHAT domain-containing protein